MKCKHSIMLYMNDLLPRDEIKSFYKIFESKKSEFVYLRGRRRVGKSALLKKLAEESLDVFLFTGLKDAKTQVTLSLFAKQWLKITGDPTLTKLKKDALDWITAFEAVSKFVKTRKERFFIFFDEIQWLAKQGNGFISALKTAWLDWELSKKVCVVVCGSSNKFFADHVGGEEKILRGLQTAASIWLKPFSFNEVKKYKFSEWNNSETALAYFMTGGVPYYFNRIDSARGFIHGINEAFFIKERNLLEEIDEIVSLEFNQQGQETVKKILSVVGQSGSSQKQIVLKTGLSEPVVSRTVENLVRYSLLFIKKPYGRKPYQYEDLPVYYMKDFFLNFYFQVLSPLTEYIKNNEKGLLFPYQVRLSDKGYYLPNFTGKAFELFIRDRLENSRGNLEGDLLCQRLMLTTPDYEVLDYWDKNVQVDLIVLGKSDRILRVIECKWGRAFDQKWIKDLEQKTIPVPNGYTRKNFVIYGGSDKDSDKDSDEGVFRVEV